ncbi:class I SAM-dependent RNA methyltransferase [Oceanibaculum sp.]|uniref:class I SAM-dependent RNA methyltransferase n=1 Tax=Oceanibaculum sp. TaxID=1903597 RepID=UPI002590DC3A|nr:class I SAM-dependent RNA methyltransferase [Oceanibaculum sp.]MCH2393299.1 class I SAM-dependent RNA methyltransferase [Oceanibaculum sp.]
MKRSQPPHKQMGKPHRAAGTSARPFEKRPEKHPGRKPARAARKLPANTPPVELTVTALGVRGDGLAEAGGKRYFVPLTVPGDRLLVRPLEETGDGIRAEILELLEAGPDRREPPCPYFGRCGGCTLQHLTDTAYRAYKQALLLDAVAREGIDPELIAELVTVPPHSRRRAILVARKLAQGTVLGFHEHRGHFIVDIEECTVLAPALMAVLPPLRALLDRLLPAAGNARATMLSLDGGIDLLLDLPEMPDLAGREALAGFAAEADLARLSITIEGGTPELLAERRAATLSFAGIPVAVPPGAFLQATPEAEAALLEAVLAGVGEAKSVADLYAGCGTFSLPLAAKGAAVHAVEGHAPALEALATASRKAGSSVKLTVEKRDLAGDPLAEDELNRFDAVVFDPPRTGARSQAAALAKSQVPVVVAVSCNPATFARDMRLLLEGGYQLERITPIDQFLWSAHLELVAVFRHA